MARLALVAVFTLLILFIPKLFSVTVPFIAALAFGVLIALPLGMFLFKRACGPTSTTTSPRSTPNANASTTTSRPGCGQVSQQ